MYTLGKIPDHIQLTFTHFTIGRSKFLQFTTGSQVIPPMDFLRQYIQVRIVEETDSIHASTCFHVLTVPPFSTYDSLQEAMDSVICVSTFTSL